MVAALLFLVVAFALSFPAAAALKPVDVGIRIRNLIEVDELHERWNVSGAIIMSWMEPKLKYRADGPFDDHRAVSAGAIQMPSVGFANAFDVPTFRRVDLFVRPSGRVFSFETFRGSLSTPLDLRRFPFDREDLSLIVVPLGNDVGRIVLIPDTTQSQLVNASYSPLSQWRFLGLAMNRYAENYFGDVQHGVNIELRVQRNAQSYVWKFIVPLCLIVVISWVSFWLTPVEFTSKELLGTAVTTLLIVVAFTLSLTAWLPRTSYMTYIDAFLLTCFLFVIAAIGSIIAINVFEQKGKSRGALYLRRIAGAVLPIAFVLVQTAVFVYF